MAYEKDHTTLSELLRQKRQLLDLDLTEVEEKTGIREKHLRALETGTFHELPAAVYVQGYLKTLSRLYGLEFSRLLILFKEEQNVLSLSTDVTKLQPRALNKGRFTITAKTLAVGLLSFGFLLVTVYMVNQINHVTAAPEIQIFSPNEGQTTTQNSVEFTGATEPGATVTINNQVVPTDPSGNFKQTLYLSEGENQVVVKAINRFNNYSEVRRRIVMTSPPQVLGESTQEKEAEERPAEE